MEISNEIRNIERMIDCEIEKLDLWKNPKEQVLFWVMNYYLFFYKRLVLGLQCSKFIYNFEEEHHRFFEQEGALRSGVFWALKWANKFCDYCNLGDIYLDANDSSEWMDQLDKIVKEIAPSYQCFVDLLKMAGMGEGEIQFNKSSSTIIYFQGKQSTDYDKSIVEYLRATSPNLYQVQLTHDDDQLTSKWKAGDYRRVMKYLASIASQFEEKKELLPSECFVEMGALNQKITYNETTSVQFKRPEMGPERDVFDDLIFPDQMKEHEFWKIVSFLETPIVKIGEEYIALSSDIIALSQLDDYMLRLAARIDNNQYCKVSGLREHRMIEVCDLILRNNSAAWHVEHNVKYNNPVQDADILAKRDGQRLVLQLKSTLCPEAPSEVTKRNEDILKGIGQIEGLINRGEADFGLVITDGYQGDYKCWAKALVANVCIATMYDMPMIANDPQQAIHEIKRRLGINGVEKEPITDLEFTLFGWNFRIVDGKSSLR